MKKHNLAQSRNFRSPKLKVKGHREQKNYQGGVGQRTKDRKISILSLFQGEGGLTEKKNEK